LLSLCEGRIASQKSSFLRFKPLFSSNSVLISPSGPLLRSSALKLEKHMAFVREKSEPYDRIEPLAVQSAIKVPAITLEGLADGNFPASDGSASAHH
jgi:hypothetical protein